MWRKRQPETLKQRWKRRFRWLGIGLGVLVALDLLGLAVTGIILKVQLERVYGKIGARSLAELAAPPVPDDQNAIVKYVEAANVLWEALGRSRGVFDTIRDWERMPPDERAELYDLLLADGTEFMRLVREGAARNLASSLSGYDSALRMMMEDADDWSDSLDDVHFALKARASWQLDKGEYEKAYSTLALMLRVDRARGVDPSLLAGLSVAGSVQGALRWAEGLLDRSIPSEATADALLAELDSERFRELYNRGLRGEVLFQLSFIRDTARPWTWPWDIEGPRTEKVCAGLAGLGYGCTPLGNLDMIYCLKIAQEQLPMLEKRWIDTSPLPEPTILSFTAIGHADFHRYLKSREWTVAHIHCAKAAVMLKRYKAEHGEYPVELPAEIQFADPFSDDGIRYKREGDGFVVYSIGPDQLDDGGTGREMDFEVHEESRREYWPWDITFRCAN